MVGVLFSAFENVEKSHSLNLIFQNITFPNSLQFSIKTTLPYNQNFLMIKEMNFLKQWKNSYPYIKLSQNGDNLYQEVCGELGLIKAFSQFYFGVSVSAFKVQIKNYNEANQFSINIQSQYEISKTLNTKICLRNLKFTKNNVLKDDIPQILKIAFSYNPLPKHRFHFLIEKDTFYPMKTSIYYSMRVLNSSNIICGYSTLPAEILLGLDVKIGNFKCISFTSFHPVLGSSYSVSLSYAK